MTSAAPPVLTLAGVAKAYGGKPALKGVSLEVRPGEMVGLLGPNGAGKSTLFQICAGLFAADAGVVEVFGQCYRRAASAIHGRLGVVFQARSLDAEITGRANLRFHGGLFGLCGAALRARIEDVAASLDIADLLDTPVRELSGGNQRRVEIARALLSGPDLLLLDEPSTGLDAAARRRLLAQLRTLGSERGTALLWATHLCEEVECARRIVVLARGEVVRTGAPAELICAAGAGTLTEAYIALTGGAPAPTPARG